MTRFALRAARVGAAALAGLFLHCAHVEPPSGGPVDVQPPYVIGVFPAPGARNVSGEAALTFKFSEWIDRSTGRGQVLLSPPFPGKIKVKVDGDQLSVQPPEPFHANTAYRFTVLGSLKDLHGVSMGANFSQAFTTGADFDSGSVSGQTFAPDQKARVLVALYRLSGRDVRSVSPRSIADRENFQPDSLPNIGRELPALVVQADSAGMFAFDSVAQGHYALFAFEDINGNLTPDVGFEPTGIGALDLSLTPRAPNPFLRLALMDTNTARSAVPVSDTTAWSLVFLDAPDGLGVLATASDLLPGNDYQLRSNHPFTGLRWSVLEKRLEVRVDTMPVKADLQKLDSVNFSVHLQSALHPGRSLQLRLKPGQDSGFKDTAFRVLAVSRALDSARLGGVSFHVPERWKGWTFLLQYLAVPSELLIKPMSPDSAAAGPLATGRYRLAAFQDKDQNGFWNPGSLHPWREQEPYRVLSDSINVDPGPVTNAILSP